MEAIKQIVRTPRNHKIQIIIPDHIPENEPVEIVLLLRGKREKNHKINELKKAMKDKRFLKDLEETFKDFEKIDLADWQV